MSIALFDGSTPVLGVVLAPCPPVGQEDLIAWVRGGPVIRGRRPVRRTWPTALDGTSVVLVSQDADTKPDVNRRLVEPARYLPVASVAYRMALVAVGEGDAAVSVAPTFDYDFAGAHAILRGAGGVLLDASGREPTYETPGASSGGLLVGGAPALAQTLMKRPWQEGLRGPTSASRLSRPKSSPRADPERLERARGVLLGQLVGDSLGAQVEFQSAERIAAEHPNGVRSMVGGGPWSILAGQPTDDSELALALARSLIEAGGYDPERAARAYAAWLDSAPFDVGVTTRQAMAAGVRAVRSGVSAAAAMRAAASRDSQANGALMRVCPLGLFAATDRARAVAAAVEDAQLTHPHPVCKAANAAFVAAVGAGIEGQPPKRMLEAAAAQLSGLDGAGPVRERLERAERGFPPIIDGAQQGWVLHAFENAFLQLLEAESFEDGIVHTIARGGDTDTNAAIAGALLGAAHGAKRVPPAWRRAVLTCRPSANPVERAESGADRPRPPEYWPVDALILAERLLTLG